MRGKGGTAPHMLKFLLIVAGVQRHALLFTGGMVVPRTVFDAVSWEKFPHH
jgi:hypothetical protein